MTRLLSFALALVLVSASAYAQEKTLMTGDVDHDGFGGVIVKGTTLLGEPALLVGGGGAWIIDHTILLGLQGAGLSTIIDVDRVGWSGRPYRLQVGEGGVKLGFIYGSNELVHGLASVTVGAGTVFYTGDQLWNDRLEPVSEYDIDEYFVAEPEIMAELNVAKWMRVTAGVGYRFVTGVNYDVLTNEDLSGPTASLMLKFGSF